MPAGQWLLCVDRRPIDQSDQQRPQRTHEATSHALPRFNSSRCCNHPEARGVGRPHHRCTAVATAAAATMRLALSLLLPGVAGAFAFPPPAALSIAAGASECVLEQAGA